MKGITPLKLFIISILFLVLGIILANQYATLVQAQEVEPSRTSAIGTTFTYQGRLTDGGSPANGKYDLAFRLYNAKQGGGQIGGLVSQQDVVATDGFFTAQLDFGDVFDGTNLWLQIALRPGNGSGSYTTLTPRQPLTAAPYALHARTADNSLGALSCSNNQIAKFDGSKWVCAVNQSAALEARVADLEELLIHLSRDGNELTISGANLHVVNGNGSTDSSVNGLGNVIIGYNEERTSGNDRSGSHMLVVGKENNYSNYGGVVVGLSNTVSGNYASVSGGSFNTASSSFASVSGGLGNTASGTYASVSGGYSSTANAENSSVSGGRDNTASGQYASVSGGQSNTASGQAVSVSGGYLNSATGIYSSVSGGRSNTAKSSYSSVSGGQGNTAGLLFSGNLLGDYASVGGGQNGTVSAAHGWRAGSLTSP